MTTPSLKLKRLTIRLPPDVFERLREVSFAARRSPAELARTLLSESLKSGKTDVLPLAAAPVPDSLSESCKRLLVIIHAAIANMAQLDARARNSVQLDRLSGPGAPLDHLSEQLREIGLGVKNGSISDEQAGRYIDLLIAPGDRINRLARALNIESASVPLAEWHGALSDLTAGLK